MDPGTALTKDDASQFGRDLATVKAGLDTLCNVHEALERIRHNRWWQTLPEKYRTWKDFCRDHLGYSRGHVRYMLNTVQVVIAELDHDTAGRRGIVVPEGITLRVAHLAEFARVDWDDRQKVLDIAVGLAEKAMPAGATEPKLTVKLLAQAIEQTKTIDVSGESRPAPPPDTEPLDVPDACLAEREMFVQLQRKVDALGAELKGIRDRTSATFLQVDPLLTYLRNVWSGIKWGMPHCWCLYCGGGVDERDSCESCRGLGFNPFGVHRGAPKDLKASARLWNFATTRKKQ